MKKKKKTPQKSIVNSTDFINMYLVELTRCIASINKQHIQKVIDVLVNAYKKDKQVFIFGNGGSASTASHMTCDLGKGTLQRIYDNDEKRFRVISLNDNVALLTAFANDLKYEDIFIQQLRNLIERGDVVIALSGSGNSRNIIKAVEYANACEAITIGVLGYKGGKVGKIVKHSIIIDSKHYGPIEDIQLILNHMIAGWISRIKHIYDNTPQRQHENKAVPFK